MSTYTFPTITERPAAEPNTVYTIANGDLRLTTNVKTWSMQQQVEGEFAAAVEALGWNVQRAHDVSLRREAAHIHLGVRAVLSCAARTPRWM